MIDWELAENYKYQYTNRVKRKFCLKELPAVVFQISFQPFFLCSSTDREITGILILDINKFPQPANFLFYK
jgi:hypothetical protein